MHQKKNPPPTHKKFMRSTLTRRLRVWEQLFNQTQREGKRGVTTTSAMTKSDGVVSMWSQVEAAPKVRVIFLSLSFISFGGFRRQRTFCVGVLHSVSFREKPFADLSRFVVVSLMIIRTQSWGSRNCFTRTKIRRKCSSARALTETITVSL